MTKTEKTFREFEQAGWDNCNLVDKYHEHISGVTTQSIPTILEAAGVGRESQLLDVACGAGYIANAAEQLGATAVGVDFSPAQIRLARATYSGVRFEQADAEALPFEAERFDAVTNAFGLCHVANPERALLEAFRVLKRGGRFTFAVWDLPERAVGFGAIHAAVNAHGSYDVGLPAGPNFFLLSDPKQSAKMLIDAGFVSPSFRTVPQVWRISDPDQLFKAFTEGSVRAAATIQSQSKGAVEAIRQALRATVLSYKRENGFEVPMPSLVASAIKP